MISNKRPMMPLIYLILLVIAVAATSVTPASGQLVHEPESTVRSQQQASNNMAAPQPDEVFSSVGRLHQVFIVERNIARFLTQYAASVSAKLHMVKR
jgi:hypothetical protein